MSNKIVTVTLNPCIDRTLTIENGLEVGGTNRVVRTREELSGKGLNISYLLQSWKISTSCEGFDFPDDDSKVCDRLVKLHIPHRLVNVPGHVRMNVKIFDESNKVMTEFNEKGIEISESNVRAFRKRISTCIEKLDESDILVLTGSVPPGMPNDIYKDIIMEAKEKNVKTVLDASGELLKQGVQAGPYLVKPNRDELHDLLGEEFFTKIADETREKRLEDIVFAARALQEKYGIVYICITLGEKGAVLISDTNAVKADKMKIHVRGVQGAGDSVVAGICVAMIEGKEMSEMLRYGMAAAGGSLMQEGTGMCTLEDFERLKPQVILEEMN